MILFVAKTYWIQYRKTVVQEKIGGFTSHAVSFLKAILSLSIIRLKGNKLKTKLITMRSQPNYFKVVLLCSSCSYFWGCSYCHNQLNSKLGLM